MVCYMYQLELVVRVEIFFNLKVVKKNARISATGFTLDCMSIDKTSRIKLNKND